MSVARNARALDEASLPVIELGSVPLEETAAAVRRACEQVGFFYVAGHDVRESLVRRVFDQSARFHALALEEKQRLAVNRFHRGYIPLASYRLNETLAPNLSESLVMMHELATDDPDRIAEKPLQGPNQWPDLSGFRETMLEYVSAMESLGRKLLSAFALGLDLPGGYFAPMFDKPTTFLRLLHYPPQPVDSPDNQFGSAPHTDYGAITILAQDSSGGLHVRHRSGEWIQATPIAGTFVVNAGDVMARWTNDRFVSTPHRVLNLSGGERYSVPFFFDPNMEAVVECLSTCQGAGNPPKYPPIPYGEYLLSRLNTHYAYRNAGAAGV
jgi:isopenicillin N synthase-like dioxygenase